MTRKISQRLTFTGTLLTTSPLHIGSATDDAETDMPLARNGRGEFYIPGTSLAGPLSSWFADAYPQSHQDLFGFADKKEKKNSKTGKTTVENLGHASLVLVEDTILQGGSVPEIRDGVGIDRWSGAAADGIKYDREILPEGTKFRFEMAVEIKPDGKEEQSKAQIAHMVAALKDGKIPIGGSKTRGLGKVKLKDIKVKQENLLERTGILAMLKGVGEKDFSLREFDQRGQHKPTARHLLNIAIDWEPDGPLMVKADAEGVAVDMLPLFSGKGETGKLARVIPGSSLKGPLRSCGERIVATLMDAPCLSQPRPNEGRKRFLEQMDRFDLIRKLFGDRGRKDDNPSSNGITWDYGLSALSVVDCYCDSDLINRHDWPKLVRESEMKDVAELAGGKNLQPATHVAIDRWTGAAADGALYSTLEPFNGKWQKIELQLDLDRLPEEDRNPALALLVLILREMAQGRIPLGYGTNRGMGSIKLKEISFSAVDEGAELPLDGLTLTPDDFGKKEKLKAALQPLQEAWKNYLDQSVREDAA